MSEQAERLRRALDATHADDHTTAESIAQAVVSELGITEEIVKSLQQAAQVMECFAARRVVEGKIKDDYVRVAHQNNAVANALSALMEVGMDDTDEG